MKENLFIMKKLLIQFIINYQNKHNNLIQIIFN